MYLKKATREALRNVTEKVRIKKNLSPSQRPEVAVIVYEEFKWFNKDLGLSEQLAVENVKGQMGVK